MNTEMESNPIPSKRPRISVEESAVGQTQEVEARSPNPKRWLCNELIHELCKEIPTSKTGDSILLTARNVYGYLAPMFTKKLIYGDAIAFLKTILSAKRKVRIRIDAVAQDKESKTIVVIKQAQSYDYFELKTSHFRVRIWNVKYYRNVIYILNNDGQFENVQMHYFLRLIAPLLQPIHLDFYMSRKPIEHFMHSLSLNSLRSYIDSIRLSVGQFNSTAVDEALDKYNKLEIFGPMNYVNVPKLIHWLTFNNNTSLKKCYLIRGSELADIIPVLDEIKKEFARATSKSRFVVRLKVLQPLDEFTLSNELTGERLKLRSCIGLEDGWLVYALSRFPNNELDDTQENCTELIQFVF